MALNLIAYARVSTREQAKSGLGLAAQERTIREAARQRGDTIIEYVRDEGFSGKTLERPGLIHALERIAAGDADGLIVAKLDRCSRSTVEFALVMEWFVDADATLIALDMGVDTTTEAGRLVARVLAAAGEWDRERIVSRTRDALAELRADGKPTGPPTVADHPDLAARIESMREDGMSLRAIADQLNAEKIPTVRGAARWSHSSVQAAAGYQRPRARRARGALPPIRRRRASPQAR